ncbi:MAG: hypothetical protein HY540_01585 [Deltaproteobacteria bacterium]|nr:hypothetical protein [Deltaproteobacteria bacterium]
MIRVLGVCLILVSLSSCLFGRRPVSGVVSYRAGKVYLKQGNAYQVGALKHGWRPFPVKSPVIAFHHDRSGATLFTDAFCGDSFEDAPHEVLLDRMVHGVEDFRQKRSHSFTLNGRKALATELTGKIDGVTTAISMVVVKKHTCLFDFVLIASPDQMVNVRKDFETFYQGFEY